MFFSPESLIYRFLFVFLLRFLLFPPANLNSLCIKLLLLLRVRLRRFLLLRRLPPVVKPEPSLSGSLSSGNLNFGSSLFQTQLVFLPSSSSSLFFCVASSNRCLSTCSSHAATISRRR